MVTRTTSAPPSRVARLADAELRSWNRYRIGTVGTGANRRRLDRWWRIYRALERERGRIAEMATAAAGLILVGVFCYWWTVKALERFT